MISRTDNREKALDCPEFDLRMTLESGQTFHWIPWRGGYAGCIGNIPITLRQESGRVFHRGGTPELISRYFAWDHDLEAIRSSCGHPVSRRAALDCSGLRIMRQPHWECIASFILSPMKQVAHIRGMSLALRTAFGRTLLSSPVPSFPEPSVLAGASEADLRKCGLGFRAKSLLGTAQRIASGEFDPGTLDAMNTAEARKALCALPGIGRKVANCILLFSYERLEALPVDVWIARILGSFRKRKATHAQLERYGERLLGPYAGYIQQYLFHQARTGKLELKGKRNATSFPGDAIRRSPRPKSKDSVPS